MLLMDGGGGKMDVEGDMERTWRVGQEEIVKGAGQEAAREGGSRSWMEVHIKRGMRRMEGRCDSGQVLGVFSLCCRHFAIAGRTSHVATFDRMTGTLHSGLQLQETCRDIMHVLQKSFVPSPIQVC